MPPGGLTFSTEHRRALKSLGLRYGVTVDIDRLENEAGPVEDRDDHEVCVLSHDLCGGRDTPAGVNLIAGGRTEITWGTYTTLGGLMAGLETAFDALGIGERRGHLKGA